MKNPKTKRDLTQRGSALIVVLLVMFMLILLAVAVTSVSSTRSFVATEMSQKVAAQSLAEAGIGAKLAEIEQTGGANFDPMTITTEQGTVTVTASIVGSSVVRLIARAETRGGVGRFAIEAHVESAHHQAFYKAIYVGNKQNLPTDLLLGPIDQPDANPPVDAERQDDWETYWEDDADYVDGDIWVNGKIMIKGDTLVFSNEIDSTETVDGDPVEGTITEGVSPIAPPDLEAMDYRNQPETVLIDDPTSIPADLQGVFFAGFDRDDTHYRGMAGNQEQSRLFHLGRPTAGGGTSSTIQFDESHNGKIYYVQGNLWLHSDYDRILNLPDDQDIQVTIVVEGNLFISDDLNYGEDSGTGELTNSAVLFIVKGSDTDPESFHDANRNYVYDGPEDPDGIPNSGDEIPGETIINDTGTLGVYDGPHTEGQGNVYFGDARFGTGGVTHGYMYAQNCAYLLVPPVDDVIQHDREKIYGVLGFLNAGQIFDLGEREKDEFYRSYKVKYDRRLQDGDVSLPGIPRGHAGGFDGLRVISWRALPSG